MTTQKKSWSVVLAVAIVAVIIGGGVYYWQTQNSATGKSTQQNTRTYSSSEFDYSFDYPEDWYLTKASRNGETQPEVVWISQKDITNEEQRTEWNVSINRSSLESNMRENLISREEITFAGQSAAKIFFTGDFGLPLVSILIPQNEDTFVISYDPEDQYIAEIDAILKSFAFTGDSVTYDGSSPQDIVYKNATYGFALTFPSTWKDYTTKSRTITWGTYGNNDSIDFGFPVQKALFNVGFHPKSQWQALQSEEGPIPAYLGESNEYIFSYSTGQYVANDDMLARMGEVQDIIKTFVVLE